MLQQATKGDKSNLGEPNLIVEEEPIPKPETMIVSCFNCFNGF